ncbi:MAG: hypothetical protein R6U13_01480, partial [Desulfatiglandaceae bacterium]
TSPSTPVLPHSCPRIRGFPDERFDLPRRTGIHTRHVIVVSEAVIVVVIGFLECRNAVLTWSARRGWGLPGVMCG